MNRRAGHPGDLVERGHLVYVAARVAFFLPVLRILLVLAVAYAASAGAVAAESMGERFLVRSWHSEDGLPGSIVRSVAQGADGYLWVVTAEGVVRFDGIRFTPLIEDARSAAVRQRLQRLLPLPDGSMWITIGRGGLIRCVNRTPTVIWNEAPTSSPGPYPEVTQVVATPDRRVVIVRGEELWEMKGEGEPYRIERSPELELRLREDAEGWAKRGRPIPGLPDLTLHDRHRRTWTADASGALRVTFPGGDDETISIASAGIPSRIAEMQEDAEGNVWLAAGEGGLVQIRDRRARVLSTADGLRDQTALAVMEDRGGVLWVAGRTGGVDRIENGTVTHHDVGEGGPNRPVAALFEDRAGNLWAAVRYSGVYRWNGENFLPVFRPVTTISKVVAITEDRQGRIWFGGQNGLASLDRESHLVQYGPQDGLPADTEITALAVDASDALWMGTSTGALLRRRDGERLDVVIKGGSPGHSWAISSLFIPRDGATWATTLGGGLLYWKDGRVHWLRNKQGLPDQRLTGITADAAGSLWIGSLTGIFRFEATDLAAVLAGRATALPGLQIDRSDGLLTRECSGGFQPSSWSGKDGDIWFPMVNGVASIRPEGLVLNEIAPPVAIEEVILNGQSYLPLGQKLRAGPGRSRLEFHYTALSFAAPEKVKFRLILEGLGKVWQEMDGQRSASFEAVPPGRYRFRVLAANGDGTWNQTGATAEVEVIPHFWETGWFRVLAVTVGILVAAGAGWLIARARMQRRLLRLELQHARERERARIAQDLHDDLGASLTEISMLAHLASEEQGSGATEKPLPEIAAKAHALVGALDEIVWAVNPRHDSVASLAEYLTAFAAEFLETAGIALRLDVARDLPTAPLDAEQRHGIFLVVREALNNVVKHSGASEVRLRLQAKSARLSVTVDDDGRGLPPAYGNLSEGLPGMRRRIESLGGTCTIGGIEPHGTRVHFEMPLRVARGS